MSFFLDFTCKGLSCICLSLSIFLKMLFLLHIPFEVENTVLFLYDTHLNYILELKS